MTYFKVAGNEQHGWFAWPCTSDEAAEAASQPAVYVGVSADEWPAPPDATLHCRCMMPGSLTYGRVVRVGSLKLDGSGLLQIEHIEW